MNCKDCLHSEVCESISKRESLATLYYAEDCPCFADNSEWVHIPCKFGDTLFYIGGGDGEIYEYSAEGYIGINEDGTFFIDAEDWALEDFGTVVFLTREEAEKALERRKI